MWVGVLGPLEVRAGGSRLMLPARSRGACSRSARKTPEGWGRVKGGIVARLSACCRRRRRDRRVAVYADHGVDYFPKRAIRWTHNWPYWRSVAQWCGQDKRPARRPDIQRRELIKQTDRGGLSRAASDRLDEEVWQRLVGVLTAPNRGDSSKFSKLLKRFDAGLTAQRRAMSPPHISITCCATASLKFSGVGLWPRTSMIWQFRRTRGMRRSSLNRQLR